MSCAYGHSGRQPTPANPYLHDIGTGQSPHLNVVMASEGSELRIRMYVCIRGSILTHIHVRTHSSTLSTLHVHTVSTLSAPTRTHSSTLGTPARTHSSTLSTLACTHSSTLGTPARTHSSTLSTLACTHSSTLGTPARTHSSTLSTPTHTHSSTLGTPARTHSSTLGTPTRTQSITYIPFALLQGMTTIMCSHMSSCAMHTTCPKQGLRLLASIHHVGRLQQTQIADTHCHS